MIIMSFDLSTSCSGYGVFKDGELIDYGAIKPIGDDWRERIMDETMKIAALLRRYNPDRVYAEDVPLPPGAFTLQKLGAVQGMFLSLCAGFRLKPVFLLPNEWRREIGIYDGTRNGLKRDVLKEKAVKMANEKFGLDLKWIKPGSKKNDDDIAEAILIGYSQISQNHME